MTASAIQGDREKCLASGMNNYLAKPVRALTLKALLESYLNKEEKSEIKDKDLQAEAREMVSAALREGGAVGRESAARESAAGAMAAELEKDGGKEETVMAIRSREVAQESTAEGGVKKEVGQQSDGAKKEMESRPGSRRSVTQQWVGPKRNEGGGNGAGSI
jgi:YesN/AraC family two-component response regulator